MGGGQYVAAGLQTRHRRSGLKTRRHASLEPVSQDPTPRAECRRYSSLHGECAGHLRISELAHAFVLSVWQLTHAFGILKVSLVAGEMKWNVCERTLTFAISGAIFGM